MGVLLTGFAVCYPFLDKVQAMKPRTEGNPQGRCGGHNVRPQGVGECELRLGSELFRINHADVVAREVALQQHGYLGHRR